MKRLLLAVPLAIGILHTSLAAEGLGERTLIDSLKVPVSQWKTEKGISATVQDNQLVLRSSGVDYGWATTDARLPIAAGAKVEIEVAQVVNGQLGVQIEWFRGDGTFIGKSDLLKEAKAGAKLTGREIADLVPKEGWPRKFNLKFWVEGRGAEIRISKAIAQAPLTWRKADTKLVRAYQGGTKITPDKGIKVEADGSTIVATLDKGVPYASAVLEERAAYDPKATVLLDLGSLQGGVLTVQALCWNKEGTFLKAVDVMKDMAEAGVSEVALQLYQSEFPTGTAQVSFKIWLAGTETLVQTARIGGIYYGVTQ